MKFCTERDVFLSCGFCIYYIAELLESNLAHKYMCACGVSVRTSHCFAATPSYGRQSDGNVTPPFLPHSFGCRVWPSATSEHTQDMRGSCRTLSRQPPGWCLAAAVHGLAARSLAGLSHGTLPASRELSAAAYCTLRLQRPLLFLDDELLRFPLDWKKSSPPVSVVRTYSENHWERRSCFPMCSFI